MAKQRIDLGSFTSTTPGAWIDLKNYPSLGDATVYIFGTFVGTLVVQVSPDGGTTAYSARDDEGGLVSFTSPVMRRLIDTASHIRGNPTAYTSGTIRALVIFK